MGAQGAGEEHRDQARHVGDWVEVHGVQHESAEVYEGKSHGVGGVLGRSASRIREMRLKSPRKGGVEGCWGPSKRPWYAF